MKHLLTATILILLTLSQTACSTINLTEAHFIKPDKNITLSALKSINNTVKITPVAIPVNNNQVLSGKLITVEHAKATIIYFGGNEFTLHRYGSEPASILVDLQVNILMVDYRGYGQNGGTPTVHKLKQDALSIYDFAKQHNLGQQPIIVHGHSLGSMIAGYLATQRPVDGLVLEGSVTHLKDMMSELIPWYAKPFIKVNFANEIAEINNLNALQLYQNPLLIITGENDQQTPVPLAETLFKQAKSKQKQLYIAKNKHHSNALTGDKLKQKYTLLLSQVSH